VRATRASYSGFQRRKPAALAQEEAMHRPRQRGLTLIESLVGTAIVATAAASVAPGLTQWRAQLEVQQAAAAFETDVQYARTLAIARHETLRFAFDSSVAGACYVVHSGPRGACRCTPEGQGECSEGGQVWRVAAFAANQPARLETNARAIAFDPVHGTVTPAATLRFSAAGAQAVHQVVGIMGRVRSCTPGGRLAGYPRC
jgi:type IV fimbrial biogenesis protein FimT